MYIRDIYIYINVIYMLERGIASTVLAREGLQNAREGERENVWRRRRRRRVKYGREGGLALDVTKSIEGWRARRVAVTFGWWRG